MEGVARLTALREAKEGGHFQQETQDEQILTGVKVCGHLGRMEQSGEKGDEQDKKPAAGWGGP